MKTGQRIRVVAQLCIMHCALCIGTVQAQDMAAAWRAMPDEIVPLLTRNNRLDMADFVENNMVARVENVMDGHSVLDTLTTDYLHATLTGQTTLEMKLLPSGNILVVRTAMGKSSDARMFSAEWKPLAVPFQVPRVEEFLTVSDSLPQAVRELRDMPVVSFALSPEESTVTFTLHPDELSRENRKAITPLLRTVVKRLD